MFRELFEGVSLFVKVIEFELLKLQKFGYFLEIFHKLFFDSRPLNYIMKYSPTNCVNRKIVKTVNFFVKKFVQKCFSIQKIEFVFINEIAGERKKGSAVLKKVSRIL